MQVIKSYDGEMIDVDALVYSIYDRKAGSGSPPFLAVNDEIAKRMFMDAAVGESQLAKYPEDFELYRVGGWNSDGMMIVPCDPMAVPFGNAKDDN